MNLPELSVKRPITTCMIYLALMVIGTIGLTRLPIELYPNFSFGDISVIVGVRGGMPPVEVEERVTKLIEGAVGDVNHMKDVISISEEGRVRVVLTFEPGTDMDFAALEVREKISRIRLELPKEIEKPVIAKFEQDDVPILIVALTALDYTPEDLRKIVDEQIKDQVMRVEGVAQVEVGGGRERKILVEVDLAKLQAFRLPIDRVTRMLNVSNLNLLSGEFDRGREKYLIRAIGEFESLKEIEEIGIALTPTRSLIRLKDLATVKDSFLEARSYARVNTLPVVSLYIQKETTANTVEVAESVLEVLNEIQQDPRMPPDLKFITTYNQAIQVRRAIETVESSLVSGGILTILTLTIFLSSSMFARIASVPLMVAVLAISIATERFAIMTTTQCNLLMTGILLLLLLVSILWRHLRLTLIVAISIPLATIIVFGLMYFQSLTLNIMTLGGLTLGVGMLVDNSIVVLDNVIKRRARGEPVRQASVEGSSEMLLAIVASTITQVVVLLPIVFLNKEIRILYSGFSLTISYSILSSLVVALTTVPLLCSRLSFPIVTGPRRVLWSRTLYRRFIIFCLRSRYAVMLAAIFLCIAGVQVYATIPKEFIGAAEAEDFTIFVELPTGAKLEISDEAVAKVESILKDVPEIKSISSRIEPWSSKIYVKLVPLTDRERSTKDVIESLRPQIEEAQRLFKDAYFYFEEPGEVQTNEIIFEIYGWDYEVLNQLAVDMLKAIQTNVQGLTDLKIRWRRGRPEWLVRVDKTKAARYGLKVEDIANALHAQMRGLRATLYHTEGNEIEVITRLQEADRATLDKLRRMTFVLPNRDVVFLEQIAKLEPGLGPSKIWRKNHERMIQISANRGRYSFGEAAEKAYEAIKKVPFPKDYYWRFGDNYFKLLQNQSETRFSTILSLILVYLVLASLFESFIQPFIIMFTVPLAFIGAILTLKACDQSLNVGARMGMMLIGGIVVNNGIILVDEINRLRKAGMRMKRAIVFASLDRVRPIANTAGTTVIGLFPMALSRSEDSSLWVPMALVVIGGLTLSTILTPLYVTSIYLMIEDFKNVSSFVIRLFKPQRTIEPKTVS
ncbi:MAG: efflux RND transporter permease subunit [Candidatus Omnitrophica bacterium]|nr:efflux RND transporter permease subunit [Candidatus Omnitrophota bacterium]